MSYDVERYSDIYIDYANMRDFVNDLENDETIKDNENISKRLEYFKDFRDRLYDLSVEQFKVDTINKLMEEFYANIRTTFYPRFDFKKFIVVDVVLYSIYNDIIVTFRFPDKPRNLNLTAPRRSDLRYFYTKVFEMVLEMDFETIIAFNFIKRKTRNKRNKEIEAVVTKYIRYLETEISEIKYKYPLK